MLINISINSKYIFGKSTRLRARRGKNRTFSLLWNLVANLQLDMRQKLWEIPKKAHKYSVRHDVDIKKKLTWKVLQLH